MQPGLLWCDRMTCPEDSAEHFAQLLAANAKEPDETGKYLSHLWIRLSSVAGFESWNSLPSSNTKGLIKKVQKHGSSGEERAMALWRLTFVLRPSCNSSKIPPPIMLEPKKRVRPMASTASPVYLPSRSHCPKMHPTIVKTNHSFQGTTFVFSYTVHPRAIDQRMNIRQRCW